MSETKNILLTNPELWVNNRSFHDGASAGSSYDTVFYVNGTGARIVNNRLIKVPAETFQLHVNEGFQFTVVTFNDEKKYPGSGKGYIFPWQDAPAEDITISNALEYIVIGLRKTGITLTTDDAVDAGVCLSYEYSGGGGSMSTPRNWNLLKRTGNLQASDFVLYESSIADNVLVLDPISGNSGAKSKSWHLLYRDCKNKTYTFSFDVRVDKTNGGSFNPSFRAYVAVNASNRKDSLLSSSYDRYAVLAKTDFVVSNEEWQRRYITLDIPDELNTGKTAALVDSSFLVVQLWIPNASTSAYALQFKNLKLELGSEDTGWTPAADEQDLYPDWPGWAEIGCIAKDQKTVIDVTDITAYHRYYLLQSSTASPPAKPTVFPPTGSWTDAEPTYTSGSTNSLYFVDCTEFSDGTFEYSSVSLSSAYEAAKEAYNNAAAAQTAAGNAQTAATTATNRATAKYGASSTAAGTAAKVVTCADFELFNGATITVKFTTANTAAAPTLNVNGTGAKNIYIGGANASSSNLFLWAANAEITFVYNGSVYLPVGHPCSYYGASSTAAATAAKAATIANAVVCKGTSVAIQFTNANSVANPTLNISSTGAKAIYANNVRPAASSPYNWIAASTVTFTFDGKYWRMSDSSALAQQNYFWHDSEGAHVSNTDHDATTGNNVLIDADSVDIRKGSTAVATFSETLLELGKNALTAVIKMCGGSLTFTGRDQHNSHYNQINSDGCIEIFPDEVLYLQAPDIHLWYDRLWINDIDNDGYQLQDFVIEQGRTTSIGLDTTHIDAGRLYYQKWASGKLEIWGFARCVQNAVINKSSWGGGYVSTARFTLWGEWPVHFVEYPPSVSYRMVAADEGYTGDYQLIESPYDFASNVRDSMIYSPCFKFWRGATATFGHPQFSFHAVGWWKTPTFPS